MVRYNFPGDENKSESYLFRRDWLLDRMKKTNWNVEEKISTSNKGRKPKPIPKPQIDLTKPRNKFFKFD